MALQQIACKKLEMRTENKLLSQMYQAGLNSQEFARATRIEDIETICVASVWYAIEIKPCAELTNAKKKRQLIAFSELGYIWSGILFVFNQQVTVLYEEAMRQSHFTMEYFRRSQTIITMWQKPRTSSLAKKSRSRKNSDPIEHLPMKRVRFSQVEFDWQWPNDTEVDDESTIQILQRSKVMTREQISIREVISEPLPDDLAECDEFEASENGGTQKFLEIRELVAQGHSIVNTIQNERVSSMMSADCAPYEEDDYYAPMTPRPLSPLPQPPLSDIERCNEELDVDQDENVETIIERAGSASSDGIQLPPLSRRLLFGRRSIKGRKRRRLVDDFMQIRHDIDKKAESKLMRCTDARSDCVTQEYIMRQLKLINFRKPAHAFRSLQPRSSFAADTVSMMVGMTRVQKAKRREPDDLNMVQDFLNSNRQEDEQLQDAPLEHLQPEDQPRQNRKRKNSSSAYDMIDGGQQACDERMPQGDEFCDLDFGFQDDDSMDVPDEAEPILEPESFCDPAPIVEPAENYEHVADHEPNLPSVHRSPIIARQAPVIEGHSPVIERQSSAIERQAPVIERQSPVIERQSPVNERQEMSAQVSNVPRTQNFRLESDIVPRRVLRLLSQFVTVNATNELCNSGSQAMLMLNNQKNRESWGLNGVLQNLFRLWYRNVYPLGMMDLLHPEKKKLAAALAFYSIMELNSPRIGLIVIEKVENSNAIYNIAMSEKLMELLRKSN
ncbi:hypothetical protein HA402_012371 [Bradysia odoriphaga]|nr:hypothetical protein HA402_012371 [Bradysia odoriphaga]